MAPRKRTTRREKHQGTYYYDKKTKQHQWTIRWEGKRHRVKHADEETARVQFAELKRQLEDGVDIAGRKTTLDSFLPTWIDSEVKGKQSTRDDYHKRADLYILPTFHGWAIGDIKRRHVVAWVDAMMNEPREDGTYWARGSIKQALGILRRCLDSAVPEFIEYNPCAGVKVPTMRRGAEYEIDSAPAKARVFNAAQMAAFLNEVHRTDGLHGLFVFYVLLSELGPRRGEGLGLRRKDIDFDARTITIAQQVVRNPMTNETRITTPKSEAGKRDLPVADETIKLLMEQCLRVGAQRPDALVFPGKDGKQRQPNSVTQHFRRACKRIGFDGYTLHSLRKYSITALREAGADPEVAAAIAGHSSPGVTLGVYSQATMERKRAAIQKKKTS